jgi:uncharacterized protein YndB with AHSA1/START domain
MINNGRIEHEITYPHPPERVWRALTDSADLSVWLMPTDFVAEVGHEFTFDARPSLGIITGAVLAVDRPRLLSMRWSGVFGDTIVTFTLAATHGGTCLRVEHTAWPDVHRRHRDDFDHGWHDKLTHDLATLLAERP